LLKSLEDLSPTKKRLTIEIPAADIEAEMQKAILNVQRISKLPGFRPGKAPISMIEKKFSREIEAEVLEKIVPEYYIKALKEADITPVSRPVAEESFNFKRNAPLSMIVTVEVRPKVENLNYEGITVKDIPVEATDEDIEKILKNLIEERATYESSDAAIEAGDLITIDYTVKDDGTAAKDVVLKVGSGPYPQGFFDSLIEKKRDDAFEVDADFPAELESPFAGRRLKFDIKIKEVKKRNIPSLDDELAKDIGFEDIGQLRDRIKENMVALKSREAERAKQRELMDRLVETHEFEVPESLVNTEISAVISEIRATAGKDDRTDEVLAEEIKPHAEKSIKASILLELIGEKEGITVNEEEMKQGILNIAQRFHVSPENVVKYYTARDGSLDGLRRSVFEKKVLNFLLIKQGQDNLTATA
jgi:trigger factor